MGRLPSTSAVCDGRKRTYVGLTPSLPPPSLQTAMLPRPHVLPCAPITHPPGQAGPRTPAAAGAGRPPWAVVAAPLQGAPLPPPPLLLPPGPAPPRPLQPLQLLQPRLSSLARASTWLARWCCATVSHGPETSRWGPLLQPQLQPQPGPAHPHEGQGPLLQPQPAGAGRAQLQPGARRGRALWTLTLGRGMIALFTLGPSHRSGSSSSSSSYPLPF